MNEKGREAVTEKRKRTIINIVYFGIFFALSVILVRYALSPLFPFLIAYIVSLMLNPLARFLVDKLKVDRRIISVLLVLLFYATVGLAAVFLALEVAEWAIDIVKQLPKLYTNNIAPALTSAIAKIKELVARFDQDGSIDIDGTLGEAVTRMSGAVTDLSAKVISKVPGLAISVSGGLIKFIVAIISTAFLLMDYDMITSFIHRQFSEKTSHIIRSAGQHLGRVLKKYILSYALIMLITFTEIQIGLSIIGIRSALAISALIAVFDILPIVGSGMILFPWGVIEIIIGDIGTGVGVLILWAVVVLVRQIIEPKIVGDSVGMHPFLTLFAMLAGNFIYGGIGVLLLPVSLALCQSLNEAGIIHLYKPLRESDKEKVRKGRVTGFLQKVSDRFFGAVGSFFGRLWRKIFPKRAKKKDAAPPEGGTAEAGTDNVTADASGDASDAGGGDEAAGAADGDDAAQTRGGPRP